MVSRQDLRGAGRVSGLRPLGTQTVGRIRVLGLVVLLVAACTRSAVPYPGAVLPSTLTAAALVTRVPRLPYSGEITSAIPHAVFGVPEGETLIVRPVAGVEGAASGTIEFNRRGLLLTGQQTLLGSSLWVEVVRPEGGTGWVNALNLVEDVMPETFCADPRVLQLLDAAGLAVREGNGELLASLSSPRRGLLIRYDWQGDPIALSTSQVAGLFADPLERVWGSNASGATIRGSFSHVVWPLLETTLTPGSVLICNAIETGPTLRDVGWPSDLVNLNFYSVYRPAETGGGEYSWTTWLVGVEYVGSQPYLAALVLARAGI
jgi:hypothetical protein